MMNTMNYKGYTAKIEFDPRDNIFWGKVLGIRDSITFEGSTVEELVADFHNAVDFYQSDCAASGRTPQKPVSGKLLLRVPPEVHRAAIVAAQAAGTSLNQWAAKVLKEAASDSRHMALHWLPGSWKTAMRCVAKFLGLWRQNRRKRVRKRGQVNSYNLRLASFPEMQRFILLLKSRDRGSCLRPR